MWLYLVECLLLTACCWVVVLGLGFGLRLHLMSVWLVVMLVLLRVFFLYHFPLSLSLTLLRSTVCHFGQEQTFFNWTCRFNMLRHTFVAFSLFHSELKTYLFRKSFAPPWSVSVCRSDLMAIEGLRIYLLILINIIVRNVFFSINDTVR